MTSVCHRPLSEGSAGYGQVVAQGQQLPSLILQLVDELRLLPILPCQSLLRGDEGAGEGPGGAGSEVQG